MMRNPLHGLLLALCTLLLATSECILPPPGGNACAEGRFLRGQRWQPFELDGNKADFYVATDGEDSWSGTLPTPNREKTDGPFATIGRAQEAVRKLKKSVYKEKQSPIEKRWIGSPHKFGEGRDILVLIRAGTYQLSKPLTFVPEDGGLRCETNLPSGAFEYHKRRGQYLLQSRPGPNEALRLQSR